ncbi:spermatogenesis-associated protein 32 [Tupaia chinensis]|uniref:spermatogenesis-associated protein 32 n=1 Tax=Tupaia chinensis TaxID=246437 RepID=UPI0003C8F87A|nr:spermatogenesis-associated protein 32 [Tupaia chinensis]
MGVTGANGFPCCGKESVDIVDTQNDFSQHQLQSQPQVVQEKERRKAELPEQEPQPKEYLDQAPDRNSELEEDQEIERELQDMLQQELCQVPKPEPEQDLEPKDNKTTLEGCSEEDPEQQRYKVESLHPDSEGMPTPQNFGWWSAKSSCSNRSSIEEDQICTHRSIRVQTSKHLFWANKLIQASEHSLQRAINMQIDRDSADTKNTSPPGQESSTKYIQYSTKQVQILSAHTTLPATSTQDPPSSHLPASNLSPTLGLAELINFASSLAMASSSKMDLPSLEHMIKAPPQKADQTSAEPTQPTTGKQEPEKCSEMLPEKAPKAGEQQATRNQKDKNFPCSYLDFSKLGTKKATIEGEVKLLQPPATSPQLQEAKEDSVPETKKGNPLLLKIHFKLSSPSTPEK